MAVQPTPGTSQCSVAGLGILSAVPRAPGLPERRIHMHTASLIWSLAGGLLIGTAHAGSPAACRRGVPLDAQAQPDLDRVAGAAARAHRHRHLAGGRRGAVWNGVGPAGFVPGAGGGDAEQRSTYGAGVPGRHAAWNGGACGDAAMRRCGGCSRDRPTIAWTAQPGKPGSTEADLHASGRGRSCIGRRAFMHREADALASGCGTSCIHFGVARVGRTAALSRSPTCAAFCCAACR